jgi:hypothetical protein
MKTRQILVAALAVLTITACNDDPLSPDDVMGTYELTTVNGASLPFVIFDDGTDRFEILSGRITLRENQTFTDSSTLRLTSGTTVETEPDVAVGTYDIEGDAIVFTPDDSPQYILTISGSRLMQSVQGLTFEYRR